MKVRNGFVTNSSSSSFILAFKSEDKFASYERFKERCRWLDYEDFYNLINSMREDEENTSKKKALELLKNGYSSEYKFQILEKNLAEQNYSGITEYYNARAEYQKTDTFKTEIEQRLNHDEEYQEAKKKIEDADEIVMGMIWDTSGGVLEWSIRNGFIEDNFSNNCVLVWNVG